MTTVQPENKIQTKKLWVIWWLCRLLASYPSCSHIHPVRSPVLTHPVLNPSRKPRSYPGRIQVVSSSHPVRSHFALRTSYPVRTQAIPRSYTRIRLFPLSSPRQPYIRIGACDLGLSTLKLSGSRGGVLRSFGGFPPPGPDRPVT